MADLTGNVCAAVDDRLVEEFLKNDYGFVNGKFRGLDGYDDKNYLVTVSITYRLLNTMNFIINYLPWFIICYYDDLWYTMCM